MVSVRARWARRLHNEPGMLTLPLFMLAAGAMYFGVQFAIDEE